MEQLLAAGGCGKGLGVFLQIADRLFAGLAKALLRPGEIVGIGPGLLQLIQGVPEPFG